MSLSWIGWGAMLMAQNACGTWTSRARNGTNLWYHAVASFFNNGVYFSNLFIGVDKIAGADTPWQIAFTLTFYATFTMLGSISSHYVLMHHVETRIKA